jgi:hypothetical protein
MISLTVVRDATHTSRRSSGGGYACRYRLESRVRRGARTVGERQAAREERQVAHARNSYEHFGSSNIWSGLASAPFAGARATISRYDTMREEVAGEVGPLQHSLLNQAVSNVRADTGS